MSTSTERISEKIRKLLAIVEDPAASEAEKATALNKAASLAREHELELEDCRDVPDSFGLQCLASFRRLPLYFQGVGDVLTTFFDVRILTRRSVAGYNIEIFGSESSRAVAVYVWTYLRREFLRRFAAYKRRHPRRTITAKIERGYYESLARGLATNLYMARRETTSPAEAKGLILSEQKLDDRLADLGKLGEGKRHAATLNKEAIHEGREINIRPAMNTDVEAPKRIGVTQ